MTSAIPSEEHLVLFYSRPSPVPAWAVLQRRLLEGACDATQDFLARYTTESGEFVWGGSYGSSADDFWEPYFNWPLLYALGGGADLLEISLRQFTAIKEQLQKLGALKDGYERGSDQFHQSEANTFLASLVACTNDDEIRRHARTIAGMFMPGSSTGLVDPVRRVYRSPILGSEGPGSYFPDDAEFRWHEGMRVYGLPLYGLPGIEHYDDLKDPELARVMGAAMQVRFSRGDVVSNLLVTSTILLGVLSAEADHDRQAFSAWLLEYVQGWSERGSADVRVPDNVGPTGIVGEDFDGRWSGGLYGWSWPHGYYSVGMAVTVAVSNALLAGGDESVADFARDLHREVLARGEVRNPTAAPMTMWHLFPTELSDGYDNDAYLVPYRYAEEEWFDWHPVNLAPLVTLWSLTGKAHDREIIREVRDRSTFDWRTYRDFRKKEDSGHEAPWFAFLEGDNPDYPIIALEHALGQVIAFRRRIEDDETDLTTVSETDVDTIVHHWQLHNPVSTEVLVQLTTGAAQPLYNGGPHCAVIRHFDVEADRPGLAADVAALVTGVTEDEIDVHLVNLHATQERRCGIVGGWYGQHEITAVRLRPGAPESRTGGFLPGQQGVAPPTSSESTEDTRVILPQPTDRVEVTLGPGSHALLTLSLRRFARPAVVIDRFSETSRARLE
ncbi:MAG: hypothetical protein ACXIUP_00555 [Microcella sp.]